MEKPLLCENPRDYKYVRPLQSWQAMSRPRWQISVPFQEFYATLVFIHNPVNVPMHSPSPLITWPSVRERMKKSVIGKFLKRQWECHLGQMYTLYKIGTQPPRLWFQVDKDKCHLLVVYMVYSLWTTCLSPWDQIMHFHILYKGLIGCLKYEISYVKIHITLGCIHTFSFRI